MKKLGFILIFVITQTMYCQLFEGQGFCEKNENGSYFPLSIEKKKILWGKSFYFETITGSKKINGKEYIELKQEWEDKKFSLLYLREENGVVFQYEECCENETVRFDQSFKKGTKWTNIDSSAKYKIVNFNGKLKTPYCNYKNLLVVEATLKSGTFIFYYLQGQGYIGATKDDQLISCVTPEW